MNQESVTDLTKGVYRRIYGGFIKGQRINQISLQAEAWFWRIMASADDFGNADADPGLCFAATVGKRRGVTQKDVAKWLVELGESRLIQIYADESGDKYLHIVGFEEMQPAGKNGKRIKRFPCPGESRCIQNNPDFLNSSLASDNDTHSDNDTEDDSHTEDDPDPDAQAAGFVAPFCGLDFLDALKGYERHRKEKHSSLTVTARRALYKKLGAWGESRATAALTHSVEQGWTGVFEENSNGKNRSSYETASERNVRNIGGSLAYLDGLSDKDRETNSEESARLLSSGS